MNIDTLHVRVYGANPDSVAGQQTACCGHRFAINRNALTVWQQMRCVILPANHK
jgi:hypothetical protein